MFAPDTTTIQFSYHSDNRTSHLSIDGDEAEYLPNIIDAFAEFVRSIGFDYVRFIESDDGQTWVIDKHRAFDYGYGPRTW